MAPELLSAEAHYSLSLISQCRPISTVIPNQRKQHIGCFNLRFRTTIFGGHQIFASTCRQHADGIFAKIILCRMLIEYSYQFSTTKILLIANPQ